MSDVIKKATRESYGEALRDLAQQYENLVVLDADLAAATKTGIFKKAYPDRFFDCGIAEANMMGVAAGLASCGKIPFASTFAMFAAGRAFEIVRNSIGYPHLNVKIGATHAGISVGEDGATHQCNEDIALMRTIPGMTIINPCDDVEAKAAVKAALDFNGPVYMRCDLAATGLMVSEALEAAKIAENEGISVRVVNIHTIKPLDKELIAKCAKDTGVIVTAEEHSVIGGLGSAVAEAVTECCPVPVVKVGVNDEFGYSGPAAELLKKFGLSSDNIATKVMEAVKLK